jgi:hypothetical protein
MDARKLANNNENPIGKTTVKKISGEFSDSEQTL